MDEDPAAWLHQRCIEACSSTNLSHNALELSLEILHVFQTETIEDIQGALFAIPRNAKKFDLSFVFDLVDHLPEWIDNGFLTEESLRRVANDVIDPGSSSSNEALEIDAIPSTANPRNYDELYCFQLETRILDLSRPSFHKLWKYLRMAGWTYSPGCYRAPTMQRTHGRPDPEVLARAAFGNMEESFEDEEGPDVFSSSNDIVEYLDQYRLPDIDAAPEEVRSHQELLANMPRAYERRAKRLRYELLEIVFFEEGSHQRTEDEEVYTKYGHNYRPCDVCFQGAHPTYPRVACRDCGLIVHTECYGLCDYGESGADGTDKSNARLRVDENGFFCCEVCREGLPKASVGKTKRRALKRQRIHSNPNSICQLCRNQSISGGMIRVDATVEGNVSKKRRRLKLEQEFDDWVHLFCLNSLCHNARKPVAQIRTRAVDIISKAPIPGLNIDSRCRHCSKNGWTVECKGGCGKYFHLLCLQIERTMDGQTDGITNLCSRCVNTVDQSNFPLADAKTDQGCRSFSDHHRYFDRPAKVKSTSRVKVGSIVMPKLQSCVTESRALHESERSLIGIDEIEMRCGSRFKEWQFVMAAGHSILLYGLGSKRNILNAFGQALSSEGNVVTLNGYDSDFDLNKFLNILIKLMQPGNGVQLEQILRDAGETETRTRMVDKAATIAVNYSHACPLFILIHNIDGDKLRSRSVQDALATLTANSKRDWARMVRIAASVDDVNSAMLLWEPQTEHKFSWVWNQVHSFQPYFDEIERGPYNQKNTQSKTKNIKHGGRSADIKTVLSSVTPKHKDVIKLLASLQIKNPTSPMSYTDFKANCSNSLIVSSDQMLMEILRELADHGIVKVTKNGKGLNERDVVYIPRDTMVHEILAYE